jgi:hypothetical protein
MLLKLSARQLLILAAAVGALWAGTFFDWSFVTGRHAFWQFPRGTITDSQYDMAQTLVGYLYYVQSSWYLPLFYVPTLGRPAGINIIFMDAVPIVALAGKLICSITGAVTNLLGVYLFLCFALPGVAMTLVLIAAKIRYALAAIIGAIFANAMPALLWRWGHIALQSQFLLIGALALYLFSLRKRAWRGLAGVWMAYLGLTYLTDIYIFAMVGTVWLCAIIQPCLNRATTTREALGIGALTVALITSLIAVGGQFGSGSGLPFGEYGSFSMNLLSPLLPQKSGLLPGLGGVIDATGGQYEGFNYLGLGVLLATVLVLPSEIGWLRRNLRRHIALFIAFALLTAFAVSNRVFIGHWLLFDLPIPHSLNRVFGIFRSSGRFFWLVGYAQIAIIVVLCFRGARPLMALCLMGAASLQLYDVQPLRAQIIASIATRPSEEQLDNSKVARMISGAQQVEVIPSMKCSNSNENQRRANIELMLTTARANIPTNTVYSSRESYGATLRDLVRAQFRMGELIQARATAYCEQEIEQARHGGRAGAVFMLLSNQPRAEDMAPDVICLPLSWARFCRRLERAQG